MATVAERGRGVLVEERVSTPFAGSVISCYRSSMLRIATIFCLLGGITLVHPACSSSDCRSFTALEDEWKHGLQDATDCGASLEIGSSEADNVAACLVAMQGKCEPAFGKIITNDASERSPILLRSFFLLDDCSAVILEYDQPNSATRELICETLSLSADENFVIIGDNCHDGYTYICKT